MSRLIENLSLAVPGQRTFGLVWCASSAKASPGLLSGSQKPSALCSRMSRQSLDLRIQSSETNMFCAREERPLSDRTSHRSRKGRLGGQKAVLSADMCGKYLAPKHDTEQLHEFVQLQKTMRS